MKQAENQSPIDGKEKSWKVKTKPNNRAVGLKHIYDKILKLWGLERSVYMCVYSANFYAQFFMQKIGWNYT